MENPSSSTASYREQPPKQNNDNNKTKRPIIATNLFLGIGRAARVQSQDMESRCDGETQEGKRCSYTGKILVQNGEHWLCWKHWKCWSGRGSSSDKPWEILQMTIAPDQEKLGKLTVKKIAAMLRDGPPSSTTARPSSTTARPSSTTAQPSSTTARRAVVDDDETTEDTSPLPEGAPSGKEGYIYAYRLDTDRGDDMYKIGFTTTTVEERLQDWPGSILVASWKTPCPHFTETLIHLFLQHWRCYRFVFRDWDARKRFVSTWFDNHHEYVQDRVGGAKGRPLWLDASIWTFVRKGEVCPQLNARSRRADRFEMEKEWFYVEWEFASAIIEGVVECVQRNANDWHKNFRQRAPPADESND